MVASTGMAPDISRTGLLVQWPENVPTPELEGNIQIELPGGPILPAFVRRKTLRGYGLEFVNLDRLNRKKVQQYLITLRDDPSKLYR